MLRNLLIFLVCAATAAAMAAAYRAHPSAIDSLLRRAGYAAPPATRQEAGEPVSTRAAASSPAGRRMTIDADPRGHFVAGFRVNGRPMQAMIDTGATLVALNVSTARKAGVHLAPADFTHEVETANGRVKVALVTLDRLEIGRIELDRVEAIVVDDRALATNLVGMNFLKRLGRYQVENGRLLLVQ
jgi:aspartyl protease family protein